MNNTIRQCIKNHNINIKKISIKNNIYFLETNDGRYVLKNKKRNDKDNLYRYLDSRGFNYFLNAHNDLIGDDYELSDYIEEVKMPDEQKAVDLIYLITLLHNKTTFYRKLNLDEIKEMYEALKVKITYLNNYYHDLQDIIETHIYMAPSEYLLIRNLSFIYNNLNYSIRELDNWYEEIKNETKERVVLIHNNLELDHLIKAKDMFLISWDKAKTASPIYDLIVLFRNDWQKVDINAIYDIYVSKYPLTKLETKLLFIHLAIPLEIKFTNDISQYELTKKVAHEIHYLKKVNKLVLKDYQNQSENKSY